MKFPPYFHQKSNNCLRRTVFLDNIVQQKIFILYSLNSSAWVLIVQYFFHSILPNMSAQQYSEDQIDYGECSPAMEDEYYEEEVEDQTADTEEMMKRMAEMDEELKQTDNDGQKVNEQLASISDQIDEKSM